MSQSLRRTGALPHSIQSIGQPECGFRTCRKVCGALAQCQHFAQRSRLWSVQIPIPDSRGV